jgi:hypothetical protein
MGMLMDVMVASQQISAGKIAEMEAKTEAKQIETAAAQREADRKEKLARAVSSQMAAGGAAGITFEGSPLSVLEEDVRREKEATQRDVLMSKLAAQTARTKGKVARKQAKGAAILGMMQSVEQRASMAAPSPSPAPVQEGNKVK